MSWASARRHSARVLWVLALLVLVLVAAFAVNLVGLRIAGSIDGWQRWLAAHSGHFLAWRMVLYAGTAWGWLWMRRRLRAREPDVGTRQRLLRVEVAAVLAVVALEASQLLRSG